MLGYGFGCCACCSGEGGGSVSGFGVWSLGLEVGDEGGRGFGLGDCMGRVLMVWIGRGWEVKGDWKIGRGRCDVM